MKMSKIFDVELFNECVSGSDKIAASNYRHLCSAYGFTEEDKAIVYALCYRQGNYDYRPGLSLIRMLNVEHYRECYL